MKSSDIRKGFLDYFAGKGHTVVPSSPLIPEGDPTLLFTNAGMVQFKGVFLDEETRSYKRAASCQRCMRAGGKHNDLENVGRTARHHTFFEMLGNFSFGDYFKEGAIVYAWDFLTKELRLPKDRLWVTVFESDDEAANIWKRKAGVPENRIVKMGATDNFWSMGDTGPCGPCSEIIIDQGVEAGCGKPSCAVGCDCDRYLELWNLVFMQYNRNISGELSPLPKPCIDTGMGLERLSSVMQGKLSNYDSDLFSPLISSIEEITGARYGVNPDTDTSIKAIADHSRAVTFLITDGVLPGNVDRGYVLRRIIRRAARHGKFLGIKEPFLYRINSRVIEHMGPIYPEIVRSKEIVERATKGEEERFFETLERGLELLDTEIKSLKGKRVAVIPGEAAFRLYDTYGFPIDLTADIVRKEGFTVDEAGFNACMEEQREKARRSWKGAAAAGGGAELYKSLSLTGLKSSFVGYHMEATASRVICIIKDGVTVESAVKGDKVEIITEETPFYAESGGQVGDRGVIFSKTFSIKVHDTKRPAGDLIVHYGTVDEGAVTIDSSAELVPDLERRKATARNHTATHILHSRLRKFLGTHVRQAGSLVSPERLRFDFNHFESISEEDLRKIEEDANRAVLRNIEVVTDALPYQSAIEKGALAFFGEKYGDVVRMVQIQDVSAELCGGTHVSRTGDIGFIKITSESSVASGVRRLEAVTGEAALNEIGRLEKALKEASLILKAPPSQISEKIKRLLERQRELEKEIEGAKARGKTGEAADIAGSARSVNGMSIIASVVSATDPKELRVMADALRQKLGSGIVVLGSKVDAKALLLAAVTRDLTSRVKAGELIKRLAPIVGGKGGGKDDMAQAGGGEPEKLDEAVAKAFGTVEEIDSGKND